MPALLGLVLVLLGACTSRSEQASPPAGRPDPGADGTADTTAAPDAEWTFDSDALRGLPGGASVFSGDWAVEEQADAPSPPQVLCQRGEAEFTAIELTDAAYADVVITARIRPISGREDQAAGVIFRVKDRDNYYIGRANALEANVEFFKYRGGQRSDLAQGAAEVPVGVWQELRVEVRGERMQAFLNGRHVVEAADGDFTAGGVGLWTKADSASCFDTVEVNPS